MNNGLPSSGHNDGLVSWNPALRPDSHQPTSSEVENNGAEVLAQKLRDDESQLGFHGEPDELPQDAFPSLASPVTIDEAEAESPVVQDNVISSSFIIGESHEANHRNSGAPTSSSPFSEKPTAKNILGGSQPHDTERLDDTRFPAYISSLNDEAEGAEPQVNRSTSESLEWANEAGATTTWDLDQDMKYAGDEAVTNPGNASSSTSLPNHSTSAPLHSSPGSQDGGITRGESYKAELPDNTADYQSMKNTTYENDLQNDYFSDRNAEHVDFFGQLDDCRDVPSLPTDEEARFEEGLPLMPTSSAQEGPNFIPGQVQGHEAVSPTWFHGTKEDSFGGSSSSSFEPPALDRKTTTQVLDSLNYSARGPMREDFDRADQPSQVEVKESPPYAKSLPGDVEDQATSTAPETGVPSMTREAQEEDLAAKWRAALGDDDLLEEDETSFDPSNFFEGDGEGFLNDNQTRMPEANLSSGGESIYAGGGTMQIRGQPKNGTGIQEHIRTTPFSTSQKDVRSDKVSNQYIPTASSPLLPSSSPIPQSIPATTSTAAPQYQSAYTSNSAFSTRPQLPESAQSFSDKSKGGYTSPYDLPMDVTRPKKRIYLKQTQTALDIRVSSNPPPPPPRSSSISSAVSSAITSPVVDSYPISHSIPAANTNSSSFSSQPPLARATSTFVTSKPSTSSFFEELPSAKPRPANIRNRLALGTAYSNPIPQTPFERGPPHHNSLSHRPASSLAGTSQGYQLVPPERMALYSHAHDESLNKVPAVSSRYSPAPAPQNIIPAPQNRYVSSSSGSRPHQPPHSMSFQPRKSSPLAQGNSVSQHQQRSSAGDIPRTSYQEGYVVDSSLPQNTIDPQYQKYSGERQLNEMPQAEIENPRIRNLPGFAEPAPLENRYAPSSRVPSKSPYAPQQAKNMDPPPSGLGPSNMPSEISTIGPPRRSQTQSPGAARPKPGLPLNIREFVQRPASTNHQVAPIHPRSAYAGAPHQEVPRSGPPSHTLNYIVPTDGREHDPLERWKGYPILAFGFGGLTVTSFPKQIPRYSAGQTTPMIKCSPGEVKLNIGKTLRLDESLTSFPGPLKSKGKKREVLDWLQKHILHLENLHIPVPSDLVSLSLGKRSEERILLWKILKIFVEHDGVVEGNDTAITAVRSLLTFAVVTRNPENPSEHNLNEGVVGITRSGGPGRSSGLSDAESLESIRRLLLGGEREKAVWCAVDNRMWDHAMLLSSTLQPDIWKQVLREFIRQEVRTSGRNTESLASLYQVFAGNWEESIDELVPPSARAGLQMVSMAAGAGPPKNALEGLDRWRETLTLILNNRSQDDTKALTALGRLLTSYGKPEAAHICYIFGKTPGLFGGADDPQAAIALLGADHHNFPFDYDRDFNNVLLTEVYEFATTVLAPSTVSGSPHLQAYKLYHAMQLAEYGFKLEAQQYCDTITTVLKSTTKFSPYYHSLFFGALEDLVERLRQAPKDGSHSWISKPSMDKVSGSVWAKFNQFIAGDESDTNSAVSGKALDQDVNGPFARVSGDSPSLSQSPSSTDLYNGYQAGGSVARSAPTAIPNSRYAPTAQYTPRPSLEQTSSFSQEPQRQPEVEGHRPFLSHSQLQPQRSFTEIPKRSPSNPYKPLHQSSRYSPQNQSYLPTPPTQPDYTAPPIEVPLILNDSGSDQSIPYIGKPSAEEALRPPTNENQMKTNHDLPSLNLNQSPSTYEASATNTYSPPINTEEPPSNEYYPPPYNYEPPSSTYDPPSYNPESTGDPESPLEKPKKKTFGDDGNDDEEFVKRAAALLKEDRARKDHETDEAFRKAAEADGKLSFLFFARFSNKTNPHQSP